VLSILDSFFRRKSIHTTIDIRYLHNTTHVQMLVLGGAKREEGELRGRFFALLLSSGAAFAERQFYDGVA
jgi:hypothetical protein